MGFIFKIAKDLFTHVRGRSGKAPKCTAVIAAAGFSERMDGCDKLYMEFGGAPVLAHTLASFKKCGMVDEIVVVVREGKTDMAGDICRRFGISKATKIMVGGPTRLESVMSGVFAASEKAGLIAIHDGARPNADAALIERAITTAALKHAAAPAIKVSSTIKRVRDGIILETVDREGLFEIQTPQVFTADIIKAALTNAKNKAAKITDDCMAVEMLGFPVHITEGSGVNIKITTNEDIAVAEAILGELKAKS